MARGVGDWARGEGDSSTTYVRAYIRHIVGHGEPTVTVSFSPGFQLGDDALEFAPAII